MDQVVFPHFLQVRDCSKDCWQEKYNPMCGTDGVTYGSECDLESARCMGLEVTLKHRGKCPGQSLSFHPYHCSFIGFGILDLVFSFRLYIERTRCWDQRAYAQKVSEDHKMGTFIPECMDDGRFQEVQCHRGTGYCWCVSETGKVIPGSALRYRRPSCARNSLFLLPLLTSIMVSSRYSNFIWRNVFPCFRHVHEVDQDSTQKEERYESSPILLF